MTASDLNGWISFDAAVRQTGRSESTLKRAVRAGKIGKRLLPAPGRRPEAYLSSADVARLFGPVHVASDVTVSSDNVSPDDPITAVVPVAPMTAMTPTLAVDGLMPVVEKLVAVLSRPQVELKDQLLWTLKEARKMTGATEPALRELVAREPGLVLRQGRRWWIKAARLRQVLD